MVPQKGRTKAANQIIKYLSLETKVLQLQIITEKENVVESIINNYYWGKVDRKLIKSNAKIESLINENHHLAKINRKANKSDGKRAVNTQSKLLLNVTDSAL